jgi:hypothetical protein
MIFISTPVVVGVHSELGGQQLLRRFDIAVFTVKSAAAGTV